MFKVNGIGITGGVNKFASAVELECYKNELYTSSTPSNCIIIKPSSKKQLSDLSGAHSPRYRVNDPFNWITFPDNRQFEVIQLSIGYYENIQIKDHSSLHTTIFQFESKYFQALMKYPKNISKYFTFIKIFDENAYTKQFGNELFIIKLRTITYPSAISIYAICGRIDKDINKTSTHLWKINHIIPGDDKLIEFIQSRCGIRFDPCTNPLNLLPLSIPTNYQVKFTSGLALDEASLDAVCLRMIKSNPNGTGSKAIKCKYYEDCMNKMDINEEGFSELVKDIIKYAYYNVVQQQPDIFLTQMRIERKYVNYELLMPVEIVHNGVCCKFAVVIKEDNGIYKIVADLTDHMASENVSLNYPSLLRSRLIQLGKEDSKLCNLFSRLDFEDPFQWVTMLPNNNNNNASYNSMSNNMNNIYINNFITTTTTKPNIPSTVSNVDEKDERQAELEYSTKTQSTLPTNTLPTPNTPHRRHIIITPDQLEAMISDAFKINANLVYDNGFSYLKCIGLILSNAAKIPVTEDIIFKHKLVTINGQDTSIKIFVKAVSNENISLDEWGISELEERSLTSQEKKERLKLYTLLDVYKKICFVEMDRSSKKYGSIKQINVEKCLIKFDQFKQNVNDLSHVDDFIDSIINKWCEIMLVENEINDTDKKETEYLQPTQEMKEMETTTTSTTTAVITSHHTSTKPKVKKNISMPPVVNHQSTASNADTGAGIVNCGLCLDEKDEKRAEYSTSTQATLFISTQTSQRSVPITANTPRRQQIKTMETKKCSPTTQEMQEIKTIAQATNSPRCTPEELKMIIDNKLTFIINQNYYTNYFGIYKYLKDIGMMLYEVVNIPLTEDIMFGYVPITSNINLNIVIISNMSLDSLGIGEKEQKLVSSEEIKARLKLNSLLDVYMTICAMVITKRGIRNIGKYIYEFDQIRHDINDLNINNVNDFVDKITNKFWEIMTSKPGQMIEEMCKQLDSAAVGCDNNYYGFFKYLKNIGMILYKGANTPLTKDINIVFEYKSLELTNGNILDPAFSYVLLGERISLEKWGISLEEQMSLSSTEIKERIKFYSLLDVHKRICVEKMSKYGIKNIKKYLDEFDNRRKNARINNIEDVYVFIDIITDIWLEMMLIENRNNIDNRTVTAVTRVRRESSGDDKTKK